MSKGGGWGGGGGGGAVYECVGVGRKVRARPRE